MRFDVPRAAFLIIRALWGIKAPLLGMGFQTLETIIAPSPSRINNQRMSPFPEDESTMNLETSAITHPATQCHTAEDLNLPRLRNLSQVLISFSSVPFHTWFVY